MLLGITKVKGKKKMLIIDQIAYQNRWLKMRPCKKSFLYLILLLICLLSFPLIQLGIMLVVGSLTMYVAHLTFRRYLKWFLVPLPFLLISLVTIMLTGSKNPVGFSHAILVGHYYIGVTPASLTMAYQLCIRSLSCLVCTYFFIFTVPFQQIIQVMSRLHLPDFFIEITMLMYRFIFIFLEVTHMIYKSQQLRFGYYGLKTSYLSMAQLGRLLVIQMLEQFQQMSVALEIKFYDGEFPLGR